MPASGLSYGCIVVLAVLAGCAPSLKNDSTGAIDQTNVGKDYWLTGTIHFCPAPNAGAKCQDVAEGHLKTDSVQKGVKETPLGNVASSDSYYHVTLSDGRAGYIQTSELQAHSTDTDPVKADCKRRGDPRIGMSAQQVEATCWGKPDQVNHSEKEGVVFDQYVYGNRNKYVYLRNGVVVSVQAIGSRT